MDELEESDRQDDHPDGGKHEQRSVQGAELVVGTYGQIPLSRMYLSGRCQERREKNPNQEEGEMPQSSWSDKRERQYENIKENLQERGTEEERAEEIAARTVNKERARSGEAEEASPTSVDDISSGRRGGLRSHRGSGGRTYDQLRNEAKQRGIKGRSRMNKAQLESVLSR
jgi:hypothetical protein